MSEWEEKLNTLLSDPDAMAQVMNMAQNLSQQMGQSGGSAPPPPPAGGAAGPAPSAPPPPPPQGDPMGDLSSLLGGIDPGMIAKLLPVLSQLNRPESGETAAFLRALRPFLKPERQDKVDAVIRPEDIDLVKPEEGTLKGVVTHLIFKGVHYEMEVLANNYEWLVHSTDMFPVGTEVGIHVDPFDIQIMKKPESEDEEAVPIEE